jgi:transposase
MDIVHHRCCGLDIHKRSVAACLITPKADGTPHKTIRSFGTMTADLVEMADWLQRAGCTHVAMESTGVYWKPIYNLLEDRFNLLLVNTKHLKIVPGHKTDVKDCAWIAELLRVGLLQASFVPERAERELRELTRYRSSLVHERTAETNRLQKTLEGANIKLASVASEVTGKSGRAMLAALVAGTTDPTMLADLAQRQLRRKIPELQRALAGRFGSHQRFLVAEQLAHIDDLEARIERISEEIKERMRPFEDLIALLDSIPGINRWTAEVVLAEIGFDMRRFPSADHLSSWAGMCPGNRESAGKRKSGRTRKGSPSLRVALTEAGHAAGRGKTYLAAQLHRLIPRIGLKKAAIAVGHSILVIIYYVLTRRQPFQDLGALYFDHRHQAALEQRLIRRLQALGNVVTVQRVVPTPAT